MDLKEVFRKLPASTDAWRCPWFVVIALAALVSLIVGLVVTGLSGGVINVTLAALLLGAVIGTRRMGGDQCSR